MTKSNKIETTEELVTGYQGAECLCNMFFPSYKDRTLPQVTLANLKKKFDLSGQLFWKQSLEGVVEENKFILFLLYIYS